jgi:DNA-binding NarL/FixJ family response regulator
MVAPRSATISVLLIGIQPLFRAGLRLLIEKQPGMVVAGEPKTLIETLEIISREKLDIILMDLDMGKHKALDLLANVRVVSNGTRVILLTNAFDPEIYSSAIRLGVKGFVLKDQEAEIFLKAIEKVHEGEVWLDRTFMADVIDMMSDQDKAFKGNQEVAPLSLITDRELEVIGLVCKGLKNKQVARQLLISESTVRHHLTSIFNKLNVSDRFELVLYAFRHGLAEPPR